MVLTPQMMHKPYLFTYLFIYLLIYLFIYLILLFVKKSKERKVAPTDRAGKHNRTTPNPNKNINICRAMSAAQAAARDAPAERNTRKSEEAVSASDIVAQAVAVGDSSKTAAASRGKADDSDSVEITATALVTNNSLVGGSHENPAEIPPEPSTHSKGRAVASGPVAAEDANGRKTGEKGSIHDDSDGRIDNIGAGEDESEYEYEDEDDAAFSGFLVDHPSLAVSSSVAAAGSSGSPARIRDEDVSAIVGDASSHISNTGSATASLKAPVAHSNKTRWREPSRQAVSMSLRAEREKTGSKRRLAQDLYRIMNQDTEEAGFSIGPKSEDSMDYWIIKLFKFDPDSNLAKDMAVLGFEHIELEMTFPDQYPFEPPFVRVVRPRFKRQTGFVMNGALCMELLTNVRFFDDSRLQSLGLFFPESNVREKHLII